MKIRHSKVTNTLRKAGRQYERALRRDAKLGAELELSLAHLPKLERKRILYNIVERDMEQSLNKVTERLNSKWR